MFLRYLIIYIILQTAAPAALAEDKNNVGCFIQGQCESSKLVGEIITSDPKICLQFCSFTEGCSHFTHYSASNICIAWSECKEFAVQHCDDCVSGDVECKTAPQCSLAGLCEGILLPPPQIVSSEGECILLCQDNQRCLWFSHDSSNGQCLLFSDCETLDESFSSCSSGKRDCPIPRKTQLFVTTSESENVSWSEIINLSNNPGKGNACPNVPKSSDGGSLIGTLIDNKPFVCGSLKCHELDVANLTWVHTYDLPESREASAAAALGSDQWWVTGGHGEDHQPLSTSLIFTPGQGFSRHVDLPARLDWHCLVQYNSTHHFLAGGAGLDADSHSYLFNSVTQKFFPVESLPDGPRQMHLCGLVQRESGTKEIVVVGGERTPKTTQIFSLDTLKWRRGVDFPVKTASRMASVPFENTFLTVAGYDREGLTNFPTIYKFIPGGEGPLPGIQEMDSWEELPQQTSRELNGAVAFFLNDNTVNCEA